MSKLRELEQESIELNKLLDRALLSSSREEKESAIIQFRSSELIKNETKLNTFIDHTHPIVSLITLANKTLPKHIKNLKAKEKLIQHQLQAASSETLENAAPVKSVNISNDSIIIETGIFADTHPPIFEVEQDIISPIHHSNEQRKLGLAKIKNGLKSYIEATENRTSEYYYGAIGTFFNSIGSYVGMSGYTKTQKLETISKLFNKLEADSAPELDDQDRAILTTGYLKEAINPLLEDESIGHQLKELLKIESSTNSL